MARTVSKKGSILLINGIETDKPAEYIADNSARNSENFEISRNVLTKRRGTSVLGGVIGGTGVEIMGGREFVREGVKYNIRVGLEKIEKYNDVTDSWDDITIDGDDLTGTTTDLVSTALPLLSGESIICITNGKDEIRVWDATGLCTLLGGTPPVAKFIQEYKTYLVCANIQGGVDISQRVQWSDTADPEEWSTGNSGAVDLIEDGGDITGLSLFGDYICVHKQNSIYLGYLVSGTAIFQFVRKSTGVGAVANGSIQNLPTGEQIFLARDGIHIFNGITAPTISSAANDEIRDGINKEYALKAWSVLVPEKDEVWIGIPMGGQICGETVYKYNYITKTLLKDTRTKANAAWRGVTTAGLSWDDITTNWDNFIERWDGTGLNKDADLINISNQLGYTYVIDNTVTSDEVDSDAYWTSYDEEIDYDDTTMDYDGITEGGYANPINAIWETKDFQDEQQRISRWSAIEVWAKGGSIKVQYSTDAGETWQEASNSPKTLTDEYPMETNPDIFYFDTVGSKIRFKFTNAEVNETLAIKQFIISYVPREYRR